jgi:hypothetical protein
MIFLRSSPLASVAYDPARLFVVSPPHPRTGQPIICRKSPRNLASRQRLASQILAHHRFAATSLQGEPKPNPHSARC